MLKVAEFTGDAVLAVLNEIRIHLNDGDFIDGFILVDDHILGRHF